MQTCELLRSDLREIHRDAIQKNGFAEMAALDLIQNVAALESKLAQFQNAAQQMPVKLKRKRS